MKTILTLLFFPLFAWGALLIEAIPGDNTHVQVTFSWEGDHKNVVLFGTCWMNPDENQLERIPGTNMWMKTVIVEKDFRGTYFFSPDDPLQKPYLGNRQHASFLMRNWKPDPQNENRFTIPFKNKDLVLSVLEMPEAKKCPWVEKRPEVKKGTVKGHRFKSVALENERSIRVYTPPEYHADRVYSVLVCLDGQAYTEFIPTPTILDNMIAAKAIPPLIAVFIDNPSSTSRDTELTCNPQFAAFLVDEMLPWLASKYRVTKDPKERVIAGSSYGGLAAAHVAFLHPEAFGNVLSQSGAFWWNDEWLIEQLASGPHIRFYLEVGKWETIPWWGHTSLVDANIHFTETALSKGYEVLYSEYNGGHDYISWRHGLADGLQFLMTNSQ